MYFSANEIKKERKKERQSAYYSKAAIFVEKRFKDILMALAQGIKNY